MQCEGIRFSLTRNEPEGLETRIPADSEGRNQSFRREIARGRKPAQPSIPEGILDFPSP